MTRFARLHLCLAAAALALGILIVAAGAAWRLVHPVSAGVALPAPPDRASGEPDRRAAGAPLIRASRR